MKRFFRSIYLEFMHEYYMGRYKSYEWLYNHKRIDDVTFIRKGCDMLSKSLKYGIKQLEES